MKKKKNMNQSSSMVNEDNSTSKESKKQQKRTKKERRRTTIAISIMIFSFSILMFSMMGYIYYYATEHKVEMFDNSYNGHQAQLAKQNIRGSIFASDGRILATTNVDANGKETREYPYANMFAHAVGYSTKGKSGVELMANYYLVNSSISVAEKVQYELNGEKNPGDNVYTTFDVDLQKIAYDSLGAYNGAVIVSDPSTGRILAMVSKPDYDPSTIAQLWDQFLQDKQNSVLVNRVTQGLYPPGSTFKIITALEYIRENPETYKNYSFQCNGKITADDQTIHCYHNSVHNHVDFTKSFAKSCNSSFANMGLKLDKTAFSNTLDSFLFNQDLPVDFPYKKSRVDMNADTSNADLMQAVIGQGTDGITPLHLNMITNIIANHGVLMKPYMIDRVESSNHQIIKSFPPTAIGSFMSETEVNALTECMIDVVQNGTAKKISGLSFQAAGKTGSAEYSQNKEESHAWFTGFAPADNPQITVTVIIESAGSGGDYAVPIAKRIMESYLTK